MEVNIEYETTKYNTTINKKLIEYVEDNSILNIILEHGIISGGCLLSILHNYKINDIDVYFDDSKKYNETMLKLYNKLKNKEEFAITTYIKSSYATSFFHKNHIIARSEISYIKEDQDILDQDDQDDNKPKLNKMKIDLILCNKKPDEIIKNFDLTFCAISYDGKQLKSLIQPLHEIYDKVGKLNKEYYKYIILHNKFIIRRIKKYLKKGFVVNISCDICVDVKNEEILNVIVNKKNKSIMYDGYETYIIFNNIINSKFIIKCLLNNINIFDVLHMDLFYLNKYISKDVKTKNIFKSGLIKMFNEFLFEHIIDKIDYIKDKEWYKCIVNIIDFIYKLYIKDINFTIKQIYTYYTFLMKIDDKTAITLMLNKFHISNTVNFINLFTSTINREFNYFKNYTHYLYNISNYNFIQSKFYDLYNFTNYFNITYENNIQLKYNILCELFIHPKVNVTLIDKSIMNKEFTDNISLETYKAIDFYNQSSSNIILIYKNNPYGITIDTIKKYNNINNIVFDCKSVINGAPLLKNINQNIILLPLNIGSTGREMITSKCLNTIFSIYNNDKVRIFKLNDNMKKITYTSSINSVIIYGNENIFEDEVNLVSSTHCNPNSSVYYWDNFEIVK
jgi:hypothetical protein